MAKRKTTRRRKAPARRRTRRSNPRAMYARRKSPMRRRKSPMRRKRNVRGLFSSPAVRFAAYGLSGAAAAAVLNQYATRAIQQAAIDGTEAPAFARLLKPGFGAEGAKLDAGIVGAGLTLAAVMFLPRLKASTKANLSAAAVGMLTAPTVRFVTQSASEMLPNPKTDVSQISAPSSAQIVARLRAANGNNNNNTYNSAAAYTASWGDIPVS
jgi:hypothetical protein